MKINDINNLDKLIVRNVEVMESKETAIEAAKRFMLYFPYRHTVIVELPNAKWGWTSGKTMAKINSLLRAGLKVYKLK